MKHHPEIIQNEPKWFKSKAGLLSMSNLKHVMANYPKGFGNPAKKYAVKLANEQITGEYIQEGFKSADMERGHVDEPKARALYEQSTFCEVQPGGLYKSKQLAYSPDGLVNFQDNRFSGAIEIKSRNYYAHYDNVKRQSHEPDSLWQCCGALHYGKFDWFDFISYCGDFHEEGRLYIYRMKPENYQNEFKMIDERVEQFFKLVAETKATILGSEYFIQGK